MLKNLWGYIRLITALLLGITILLLPGCAVSYDEESSEFESLNDETVSDSHTRAVNVDQIYEYAAITTSVNWTEIYTCAANGEWFYIYGSLPWEKDNSSGNFSRKISIVGMKLDGSEINTVYSYTETEDLMGNISYSTGNSISVEGMAVTPEGESIIITGEYTSDGEEYTVRWLDRNGDIRWSSALAYTERVGTPVIIDEKLYIPCGNQVLCYNDEGELLVRLTLENFPAGIDRENLNSEIEGIYSVGEETYVIWMSSSFSLRYVIRTDLQTGEMTDWAETYGIWSAEMISGSGTGYDFLFVETDGIFGWNFGNEEKTELVNFIDSGIIGEKITQLFPVDEETYLMIYCDEGGEQTIGYLTREDAGTIQERRFVVLGLLSRGNNYMKSIVRFNQENKEYRITVMDYTKYADPLMQLNLDITTGIAPDIIYADASMGIPFDDYARAGALEDIKPWFDQDEELNESDFLSNVFDALGLNSHWYQMPTAIKIYAYVGDARVFGDDQSWTLEDYNEMAARNPEATILHGYREELMRDALIFRWNQFVDEEEGICRFDSEEFVQLLEWLNTFPTKENLTQIDINEVRNGKVYSLKTQFRDFTSFNTNLDRLYQHQAEFIGFPSADGTAGMFVASGVTLAMSSQGDNQEGAWEFIRYFFTDEYQVGQLTGISEQLPVKLNALEALADKAMTPMLGILDSYHLNGREIMVEPPTKEMIDEWMTFLQSITYADTLNDELYNIITEEADAFFAGQKSAYDVAQIIQSRIGIYLAEQQ